MKMTSEQRDLFEKLTTLQQEIALNSISGMNDIDSCRNSSSKCTTERSMRSSVGQILSNLDVKSFIDSMKEAAVTEAVMSREEMMKLQTAIASMDVSEVSTQALSESKDAFKIRLQAMKQLSELAGYNAPKKVDLDVKENLVPFSKIVAGVDSSNE